MAGRTSHPVQSGRYPIRLQNGASRTTQGIVVPPSLTAPAARTGRAPPFATHYTCREMIIKAIKWEHSEL